MTDYLQRLKNKKQATSALTKLPKGGKKKKTPCLGTDKTDKSRIVSKDSTQVGCFSEKKYLAASAKMDEQKPKLSSIISFSDTQQTCWACSYFSFDGFPGHCKRFKKDRLIPVSTVVAGCNQYAPSQLPLEELNPKLWDHGEAMHNFVDSGTTKNYEERKALVPALLNIGKIIDVLEGIL